MGAREVVLAYSGGLDTSYAILALQEQGWDVVCCTVDTGGFEVDELGEIAGRARRLGAVECVTIDARDAVYRDFVSYVIKGNVLRGGVYPLCVAAERVQQAICCAELARERGAEAVAHGSTGAGNDQVRFDAALRTLLPGREVLAPIRSGAVSREESTRRLREAGVEVEDRQTDLSVNVSLWGTTIGGGEIHDPWAHPADDVWRTTRVDPDAGPVETTIRFEGGLPVSLDGEELDGVELVGRLNDRAGRRGIGRGTHLGDTILGIKGRIAFEAPAPIVLIEAHRELEKLVLTRWQAFWKDQLGTFYGKLLHEGQWFDPCLRDIEAFLDRSQERVDGEVRVLLDRRRFEVRGVRSPHDLVAPGVARYGEENAYWDGRDAEGFSKLHGLQQAIAAWRDRSGPRSAREV